MEHSYRHHSDPRDTAAANSAMPGAEIDVTAIDQNGKETPFFLVFNKVR